MAAGFNLVVERQYRKERMVRPELGERLTVERPEMEEKLMLERPEQWGTELEAGMVVPALEWLNRAAQVAEREQGQVAEREQGQVAEREQGQVAWHWRNTQFLHLQHVARQVGNWHPGDKNCVDGEVGLGD